MSEKRLMVIAAQMLRRELSLSLELGVFKSSCLSKFLRRGSSVG